MAEGSRSTGVVKWFDTQKGFGFITADDGNEDLFVHQSSIKSEGFRSLAEGEAVEFEIEFGGDGRKKAVDVSGPNGSFVQGGGRDNYGGGGGRGGRGIGSRGGRGGGGGGGYGGGGADGGCYTCGESGHFSRDCTQGSGGAGGGGGRFGGGGRRGGDGGCYSCGGEGHFARECPNSNT